MGQKNIIIIGAGIVGVSTAIWLQRAGHRVTLIDKGAPGMGASFGNSGLIAPWAIDPVTSPQLWRDMPGYLTRKHSPLVVKWAQLPRMLPWVARFLSHATDAKTRRIVDNLSPLLSDAVDQHKALVAGTPVAKWVHDSKINFAYPTRAAFDADAYSWRMKALSGLTPTIITGHDIADVEPMLGPATGCVAQLSGQGHVTNPGQYVADLARVVVDAGGQVVQAMVQDMQMAQGRIRQVDTDQGAFTCDAAVVTAGIWSRDLMRKLGLRVPMVAERGYHVIFENPSQVPRNPLLMVAGKFGVNAMTMGLRCAGTVELGDHHAGPSRRPIETVLHHARVAFPDLTYSSTQEWMGFRPTTPDSTPVIGELRNSGIFCGFGHQHVGLTSGPKTGRLLAQLIAGSGPNIDMAPYAPDRFA